MNVTVHAPRQHVGLLALGILSLVTAGGCGSSFLWSASPDTRLAPPPGTYGEPVYVRPRQPENERFYLATSPNTPVDSFSRFHDSLHIAATRTFWYYAVSAGGVRSPVIEATYTITGGSAPNIRQPEMWITDRRFLAYELRWYIERDWNPVDTHTPWHDLEYAVYSSANDDIDRYADAVENGRLEMGWVRETDQLTYRAGRPGEARYVNVFVRNQSGGVSAYGTRRYSSIPAPSVVFFDSGDPDLRAHLHLARQEFEPSLESATSTGIGELKAFDLGHVESAPLADLAVVQTVGTNDVYRWYRPVGDGTYDAANPAAELHTETATAAPRMIRIAAMGRPDVSDFVFTTRTGDLNIVNRSGAEVATITGAAAERFVTGDVTDNNANDIVSLGTGGIMVWGNTGEASFTAVTQTWDGLGDPAKLRDIVLADLDRDGTLDLIVAREGTPAMLLYYGNGDGTFTRPGGEDAFWPGIAEATSLAVLDFNVDGLPDLFVGTGDGEESLVFLNNGDRTFGPGPQTTSTEASAGSVAADLNGNGWPDVIETFEGAPPRIWLNNEGTSLVSSSTTIDSASAAQIAAGQIR